MMNAPVLLWLRQDLRLADHPALLAAIAAGGPVIPVYILDDVTPGRWAMGGASRWWLHHSLDRLAAALAAKGSRLILRRGRPEEVLAGLVTETDAKSIAFTRDYAPWSDGLEKRVKAAAETAGANCHRYGGFLLFEPEAIRTGAGEFYKVYSPFARACFAAGEPRQPRPAPQRIAAPAAWPESLALADLGLLPQKPDWAGEFSAMWQPGEAGAEARLDRFLAHGLKTYADERDRPDIDATSFLSPHLHFGEISPARVWHAARAAGAAGSGIGDRMVEKFIKELLWREFAYHLIAHVPSLPERAFRPEFEGFPWRDDGAALRRWQKGLTGYPIVDAGMRQLWRSGAMHNRVRMIAASFLIKDLLIPWQAGEDWFWDTLVDADIGNNAASWQWVAGSGADAAPYFRIFNPVLQGEKFDPDGAYVKRWCPELARLPAQFVHRPWEAPALVLREAGVTLGRDYPERIVDHGEARDRALAALKTIKAA